MKTIPTPMLILLLIATKVSARYTIVYKGDCVVIECISRDIKK